MGSRNRYRSGVKKTEEKKVSTHTPGRLANKRKSDARITARALQLKKERETREKARANRPTRGQGGLEIGATTKRGGSTKSTPKKSSDGRPLINGKRATSIQMRLLDGGWSVKELEAKQNAARAKKK